MDNQIVFDLFSNTLRTCKILMEDAVYAKHLQKMIDRLPPMQIGRYNQLQEWLEDVDDPTVSTGMCLIFLDCIRSNQISPYTDPLLFQAAKNSLSGRSSYGMVYRLENKLMGEITGW